MVGQFADGNLSALTDDESLDLEALIRERLDRGSGRGERNDRREGGDSLKR